MTTTLSHGATTVTLPGGLDWTDEFTWSPVEQTATPSVTGALIVQIGSRVSGRPITLAGGNNRAWVKGDVVRQLQAWAQTPGLELTLTLRGIPRQVIFRHHEKPAFESREVSLGLVPTRDDYNHAITLKLMEI